MGDARNYESDCGQIVLCYGKECGQTGTVQTICLGNEDDIRKFFETRD